MVEAGGGVGSAPPRGGGDVCGEARGHRSVAVTTETCIRPMVLGRDTKKDRQLCAVAGTRDEVSVDGVCGGVSELMESVNEIDEAYYRISKSWRSLARQDKQVALINLERLEAQADELGSAGESVVADIRALRGIIQLALE